MAQAQVVISAVDKTQAAINSALRSMKTLERTAKVTAKAVNLAFGFVTGTAIIAAFGKITDAAKKTEEGRRAIDDLNKALKDPTLVAAANAFTTALINGFTEVVKMTTSVIKEIKSAGEALGLLAAPVDRNQLSNRGPQSRGRRSSIDEIKKMENAWKSSVAMDKIVAEQQKKSSEEAKKVAQEINQLNTSTMTVIEKTVADFDVFSNAINKLLKLGIITPEQASTRLLERLDEILPEVEVTGERALPKFQKTVNEMSQFAATAAQNIQNSFAQFLFDPFKDGLRGMFASFVDMLRQMVAQILAQQILIAFFSMFTGGTGIMASFAKAAVGSLEGKAMGGAVSSNTPYIVGERGPELFVPNSSGSIVPNGRMGGVTVAPVYNIDARGATADLQKALPSILSENNRRIFDELDRRYGIGR